MLPYLKKSGGGEVAQEIKDFKIRSSWITQVGSESNEERAYK